MLHSPGQSVAQTGGFAWPAFWGAAVIGLLVSPFAAIWTALVAVPVAVVAWVLQWRGPSRELRLVVAVAVGLVVGSAGYLALGLLIGLLDGTPGTGSA